MLHIEIISVGKLKEDYLKSAISEYAKRLSKYCTLQITEIPDEPIPDKLNENIIEDIKNREGKKILKAVKKNNFVFVLDRKGKQLSSEEFAQRSEEVLNSANELLCFSKMTFPHQLIRVFLLEQIFRCFKILNHETYHR